MNEMIETMKRLEIRAIELVFFCSEDKTVKHIREKLIGEFGQQVYYAVVKRNAANPPREDKKDA